MTLDTRARRAAQSIHRAVQVMETSRTTKEPTKIDRFDRYVDRKRRNRRRGAIAVVAALTVVAIVIVGSDAFDRGGGLVPLQPPDTQESPQVEPIEIGTLTQSGAGCTLDVMEGPLTAGPVSLTAVNQTDTLVSFDLAKFTAGTDLTYREFETHVRRERRLAEKGRPYLGPPAGSSVLVQTPVRPGKSETITGTLSSGTYAVVCLRKFEGVGIRPFDLVGPVVFE